MRGNTLGNVLSLVKGELAYALTSGVATAQDQELYTLIDNKQQWLAGEYDWPFLDVDRDVSVSAGSRYATLPLNTALDYSRLFSTWVGWLTIWQPVGFGIGPEQYNTTSSGDLKAAVQRNPIQRWKYKTDSTTDFEVWPIPSTTQTFRFTGVRPLATLKTSGAYDSTKVLDLDDLMVAYFVAAEKLARLKPEQAKLKLDLANQRIRDIRAVSPISSRVTPLVSNQEKPRKQVVSIIAIS